MLLIDILTDIENNYKTLVSVVGQCHNVDIDTICEEFNEIYSCDIEYDNFKVYEFYFGPWYCTDSWVGWSAIIFNGEVVAVSYQPGRKSSQEIEWVSKSGYNEVKEHLLSISDKGVDTINCISDGDLFGEFGQGYKVSYGNQILGSKVIYKNELCKVIKTWGDMKDIKLWNYLNLERENGDVETVEMKDVLLPWRTK